MVDPVKRENIRLGAVRRKFFSRARENPENYFREKLGNPESRLSVALSTLKEDDRIQLIRACILGGDQNKEVMRILEKCGFLNIVQNRTDFAGQMEGLLVKGGSKQNTTFTKILLKNVLEISSDRNTEIELYSATWLERVLRSIPEKSSSPGVECLSPTEKFNIINDIDVRLAGPVSEYVYKVEPPLKGIDSQQKNAKISIAEYTKAASVMDDSDFIILSIGLIQSFKPDTDLLEVMNLYFNLEYKKCKEQLIYISQKLTQETGKEIGDAIIDAAKYSKVVNPAETTSRRVFETTLTQYALGPNNNEEIKQMCISLQQAAKLLGVNIKISTVEDIEDFVSSISSLITAESDTLKNKSKAFQNRDPNPKEGMKNGPWPGTGEEIITTQLGLMKSVSPRLNLSQADNPMVNNSVDKYGPSNPSSYNNKTSPEVKGISGHAFQLAVVAESCVQNGAERLERLNDGKVHNMFVNDLFKAAIMTYTRRGYHAFFEILDVFKPTGIDPSTKKNIATPARPNISFKPEILKAAHNDTLDYTKTLCLNRAVGKEIGEFDKSTLRHVPEKTAPVVENNNSQANETEEVRSSSPFALRLEEKIKEGHAAEHVNQLNNSDNNNNNNTTKAGNGKKLTN